MATIGQALRRIQYSLTKPLVKLVAGEHVALSDAEAKRLPPGQFSTDRFSVLHHESADELPTEEDISRWTLTIDGEVQKKVRLTLDDLRRMHAVDIVADFHCVTSWTRLDNAWRGVLVRDVLALAQPKSSARFLLQTALSGHTTSTPLQDMLEEDVLIAYEREGLPLGVTHGAPLRIVLPKKYAYKGVKWLTQLTLTNEEVLGFWEARGYSQTADPWKNDRYS